MVFSLTGFNTVRREGIELTGTFVASVGADLKVGSITETVTVTGESPIVDVQSTQQQRVLGKEVIDALPTGRGTAGLGVLIPGISALVPSKGAANPMDVGGTGNLQNMYMTMHGSTYLDQRLSIDGAQVRNILGSGNANNFVPDMGSMQEVTLDFGGGSVEQITGGVRINYIPREGGNTFKGSFFGTGVNSSFQGNNYTDELKARGLIAPNALIHQYDLDLSIGGPIVANKLWFFSSVRAQANQNYIGIQQNLNVNNPRSGRMRLTPTIRGNSGPSIGASTAASRGRPARRARSACIGTRPSMIGWTRGPSSRRSPSATRGSRRSGSPPPVGRRR